MSLRFWKTGKFGHKFATELLLIKLAIAHPRADFHHLVEVHEIFSSLLPRATACYPEGTGFEFLPTSLRGAIMLLQTIQKQITTKNLLWIAYKVINKNSET